MAHQRAQRAACGAAETLAQRACDEFLERRADGAEGGVEDVALGDGLGCGLRDGGGRGDKETYRLDLRLRSRGRRSLCFVPPLRSAARWGCGLAGVVLPPSLAPFSCFLLTELGVFF